VYFLVYAHKKTLKNVKAIHSKDKKMPKIPSLLSDTKIKKLKPKDKVYRLADGNNLYLEVKPNGKKYWRYRKGNSFLSIGEYPLISLKEARELAKEYKKSFELGINPKDTQNDTLSFSVLVEKYLKFKKDSISKKYYKNQVGKINNYFMPFLKDKDIKKISKQDILKIYEYAKDVKLPNDTKSNNNKSETIRKLHILIKEILRYGVHNELLDKNVAETIDLKQVVSKSEVKHFKAELDINNLRKIYKLVLEYQVNTTKNALRFLILTALRSGNIRNLVWEWVNFRKKVIIYPKEAMKTREEFRLPLTNTLIEILKEQKELVKSNYVFPSPIAPSKQMSENTLNYALKRMDLDIVPHGFRSSFSTICYENQRLHKFGYEVIEAQLSHKIGNQITRAYMRSDFLDERRELLEWWEGVLL